MGVPAYLYAKPGAVTVARPGTMRMQWAIAFGIVVVPFVGVIASLILFRQYGVGWPEVVMLATMYFLCQSGVTVGLHRHFSHRSFQTSQPMRIVLAILGAMAGQGPLMFWVATHRRHHTFSDQPGDPHSPNLHGEGVGAMLRGLWHAHIGWMFSVEQTDWARFAKDLLRDRTMFRIHRLYLLWVFLGLALPAGAGWLITGTGLGALQGFLWGGLVRMFLVNHASWCVGSVCHMFGGRPFDTHDHSANNFAVAVLAFGEGLQNNHHAFPGSYSHAVKWWEPDLSAILIRGLRSLGLVWGVKYPSRDEIEQAKVRA
jgi:stearoyl-CoA desaturase (Delta-9 desaturase)